ncbi:MAG: hypothetical protein KDA85_18295, partial [Planctomycetaceae bacterium]|nr:hypothetical protein [Planctomycetaceae bacterium]
MNTFAAQHQIHTYPNSRARRGTTLMLVVLTGAAVSVICLGAVLVQRIQLDSGERLSASGRAYLVSRSAVAMGCSRIENSSSWRTASADSTWLDEVSLDGSLASLTVTDPVDQDLANDPGDIVLLEGQGSDGDALQRTEYAVVPTDLLKPCLLLNAACGKKLTLNAASLNASGWLAAQDDITADSQSVVRGDMMSARRVSGGAFQARIRSDADIPAIPPLAEFAAVED